MDDAYIFTTPLGHHTITIDAKHANLVKPYQWTVSFQASRSSWRVFGVHKHGNRIHLSTLLWPNLFINGNRYALTFKNVNFVDYRESNVLAETWGHARRQRPCMKAHKQCTHSCKTSATS